MLNFIKNLFRARNEVNISVQKSDDSTKEKSQLDHLWRKFKEEKFQEVINDTSVIIGQDDSKLRDEALKLLGLSYFRLGQFDLSEQTFLTLTAYSANSDDWFNLMTSSTLNRNLQLSEKAYEKAIELYQKNGTKENVPIPQIIFYYMHGLRDMKEYEKAFEQFEKLKDIYIKLEITDSTFLVMRGVPFFEQAIEAGKEILENVEATKAVNFINELKNKLDDSGKQFVEEFEKKIKMKG